MRSTEERTLDKNGQPFAADMQPVAEPAARTIAVEVSEVVGDADRKEGAVDESAVVPVHEGE